MFACGEPQEEESSGGPLEKNSCRIKPDHDVPTCRESRDGDWHD